MAPLDGHVDVAEHLDRRLALPVPGSDVLHLQSRRVPLVLVQGLVSLPGRRRGSHRGHQAPRVVVRRVVDDLVRGPPLLDVARVEHHDVVRDLRHHGEVVGHVDGGGALLLDDRLECLEHLDLRGDVQRGGRLVEDQQVRIAAECHRRHQPLQLPAGDLVRVAPSQPVRVGQVQRPVELLGAAVGGLAGQLSVEHRRLGDLLPDGQGGIERGGSALREIGDALAAQLALLLRRHGDDVPPLQPDLAAGELEPRLRVAQRGQGDGGLARARLADQRDHLSSRDAEAHALDDRRQTPVVLARVDLQAVDLQEGGHHTILLASFPPAWAETSSTIRLMAMVRVAMASAGTRGAMEP